MVARVDLNADIGESFGKFRVGQMTTHEDYRLGEYRMRDACG